MENIEQYKDTLAVENAKSQASNQMIQELIQSNMHLRAATILLENKVKELTNKLQNYANSLSEGHGLSDGAPATLD